MPTNIVRKPRRPVLFLIFLGILFVTAMAIEIADPAPMDVDAAAVAAP